LKQLIGHLIATSPVANLLDSFTYENLYPDLFGLM